MTTSPQPAPIKVLIADDQALVRDAFGVLIDSAPDMTVVGTAANGDQAVTLTADRHPDVVLMDVRMPHLDGIAATRSILANPHCTGTRVLILTTFNLDEYVFNALHAGASGFLLKDTPAGDLLAAIKVIASGEALLAPAVTRRLIEEFTRHPQPAQTPRHTLDGITHRETQVLTLIGRGLSNTEIAQHLNLATPTVKTHIGRLLAKLGARDRAQLVIAAYESGILTPTQPPAADHQHR